MNVLILTTCLAAAPQVCAPRLLPAGTGDAGACQARAESLVPAWLAAHPGLIGQGWTCSPLSIAPALALTELAPGVYVHRGADGPLSPENRGQIANLGVVVGADRVAVIDPGGSRAEGEVLFAAIRARTDLPIGPVVLTHMHPDHIAGAEVFTEAGGEVIADARLPAALAARRATWMRSIPAQIGDAAWSGTVLIDPARTVDRETVLDLGGRSLTLTPVATAHTDSDLTVRDSGSDTLFTGDLVFRGLTPVIDGSLRGWLSWLTDPPVAARVVPGHGPVADTVEQAAGDEIAYLRALQAAVRAALDKGQGLSVAVPAITAEMTGAMTGAAPGWTDFDATTARNAAAAYAEMEWD